MLNGQSTFTPAVFRLKRMCLLTCRQIGSHARIDRREEHAMQGGASSLVKRIGTAEADTPLRPPQGGCW